jgi:predicted acylesterase/phospholipase RssA
MPQLRMSLTISGAVSLGAYEGGALAALLYAVREIAAGDDPPLRIDVMSGASAGSITALLAARALLQGYDPEAIMAGAWVTGDSLGRLLARGTQAPLSADTLRKLGSTLLDPARGEVSPHRPAAGIRLSYTLACLRGFEYQLPRLGRGPVPAAAFIDTYDHVLGPDAPVRSLTCPRGDCPLDAVLASGANEMGFPPRLLNRSAQWAAYRQEGIDNLPEGPDHSFWFTDGGTLDNEPLGRTLDLANEADADGAPSQRLHLLIHPHPAAAIHDQSWARPAVQPTFAQTAVRGLALQRTQSIYDDLKRVEKTNTHIAWVNRLAEQLGAVLDQLPAEAREAVAAALAGAVTTMTQDADDIRGQRSQGEPGGRPDPGPPPARVTSPAELLSQALHTASGLAGKQPARVDVISPLLLPESSTHNIDQLLSGEVLFHFGGFLDESMRRNDFDLGYSSTLQWLDRDSGLEKAGLPAGLAARALAAAQDGYRPGDGWKETGKTTAAGLLAMHPWQAARLTGRITRVLLHDFLHHPPP